MTLHAWTFVGLFVVVQLAALGSTIVLWVMARRLNKGRPDPEMIGPFFLRNGRLFEVLRAYAVQYPQSRLPRLFWCLGVTFVCAMLTLWNVFLRQRK